MKRTNITALLVTPLLAALLGCQPDTPAQQTEPSPAIAAPLVASQVPVAEPVISKPEVKAEVVLSDAEGRKLAQKSGCFSCHMVEKKLIGPAWNEIAAKYRGQKDAEAKLITRVAKGSSGAWGAIPMPPNAPRVSENDIKALVRFILLLK